MTGKYIIGVDGGSQSSKVVVFDLEGNVVCEGRQVLRPMSRPRNGIVEHPDDDLWDSIAAASRQAMAAFPGDPATSSAWACARSAASGPFSSATARCRRRS
jgi:sugar (pentulose or hexulose) kinase